MALVQWQDGQFKFMYIALQIPGGQIQQHLFRIVELFHGEYLVAAYLLTPLWMYDVYQEEIIPFRLV